MILQKIRDFIYEQAHWGIISLGVLLRLKHYCEGRSFWLDEAVAAVSVVGRSYGEILRHFELMPEFARPPMFFMLIERSLVGIFGNNELVLRLFPFLCGLGALFVFYFVTRSFLSRRSLLIALALFALADPLVYYSAELKQYATDLGVFLGLLWYADILWKKNVTWGRAVILGIVGAVALWLSNAMVFTLAALVMVLFWECFFARRWKDMLRWIAAFIFWALNFLVIYRLSLASMVGNNDLINNWSGTGFLFRGSLISADAWTWLGRVGLEAFRTPIGLLWPWVGMFLFVVGAVILIRRDRRRAALFLLPLGLTMLAGLLGKYPVQGKLILFLVPCFIVPIAMGVEAVVSWSCKFDRLVLALLMVLLLAGGVRDGLTNVVHGREWVENRQALQFLGEHYQPGDFIVMNTSAQPPFWYYAQSLEFSKKFRLQPLGILEGKLVRGMRIAKFARDIVDAGPRRMVAYRYEFNLFDEAGHFRRSAVLDPRDIHRVFDNEPMSGLPAGRVWLFLSKAPEDDDRIINLVIRDAFDRRAARLLSHECRNAAVYLYAMPQ